MEGVGPRWAAIENLFDIECRRLGINQEPEEEKYEKSRTRTFRRPAGPQPGLFDAL